jgi:hypothetical protein
LTSFLLNPEAQTSVGILDSCLFCQPFFANAMAAVLIPECGWLIHPALNHFFHKVSTKVFMEEYILLRGLFLDKISLLP